VIGSRINSYRVLSELGSGGMGCVYLAACAEDTAGLGADARVALKVIHPNLLSQPGFFERFLREARIGQEVRHENVVQTYDCDTTTVDDAQLHFLVMEYVQGQDLRDLLRELEVVPEELCRHIGREVAKGLTAIHQAGVVHRDIKPENVLITEEHVVKVMDLGVARLSDEAVRLSQTGAFVGSVEYASPEQFRTADTEPDGRSDLYSLGVLLYELSTGQQPHRHADIYRVIKSILEEEPRKPGQINPQLSPFFEEVVCSLMAKDRDARFRSAEDLVHVLTEGEDGAWWEQRATALRAESKRPLRRVRIPRETALYGREAELEELHMLYERARSGDGQVLLLQGEAGIGKTRLVDEFVGHLHQEGEDINFLYGSYPPGGGATAAGAFSEAYREQFGEPGSAPWLSQTPLLASSFDALLRGEPAPEGAEPLTRDSLQTVFVHATRSLARERPTIVLIDDLHFATEDARALFMTLALAVPGHAILLIGTARPGADEKWVSAVTQPEQASQLVLPRLGAKDLTRLLRDAFRSERLAEELGFKIAEKSDGNPFFAFEIICGLREGQFITQQADGRWATSRIIQDIEIPSSVLDLVNARVADLTEEERDLLDLASCCGFEFDPLLLCEILGLSRITLLKTLGQIERKHRLVRTAGRHYLFDHHQVQEALYGGLSELLREEYHGMIASALEERHEAASRPPTEIEGALCVDLLEHFLKSGEAARGTRYLDPALDHLNAGYLNEKALNLLERALAIGGLLEGSERAKALLRLYHCLDLLGRPATQEAAVSEARALAEAAGDDPLLAKVEHATAHLLSMTGRSRESRSHYERAREMFAALGDRGGEADAINGLGIVALDLGEAAEAMKYDEMALAIRREIGDVQGEAASTINYGITCRNLGRMDEAREYLERGVVLARECGNRRWESNALNGLGGLLFRSGRFKEAQEYLQRALGLVRDVGYRLGEGGLVGFLGLVHYKQASYRLARSHHEEALAIHEEGGRRIGASIARGNLGSALLKLGLTAEARTQFELALDIARDVGDRRVQSYWLQELGSAAAEEGNLVEARRGYEQALALRRKISYPEGVAETLRLLGVLLIGQGLEAEGGACLEEATGLARKMNLVATEVLSVLSRLAAPTAGGAEAARSVLTRHEGQLGRGDLMAACLQLFRVTGDRKLLAKAKGLLDQVVEDAPEECRALMLANVGIHREITQAWEAEALESAQAPPGDMSTSDN
jgi:serine/threonine protein kinase/tetratricopeptide (TPR) repeat protein